MKVKLFKMLALTAMVGLAYSAPAFSEEKASAEKTEHEGHHQETAAPAPTETGMMGDKHMMGKMDMDHMQGMMHECMEKHKDGKMCNHDMMEKCQAQMSKEECHKMMKQAKAQEKSTKKK